MAEFFNTPFFWGLVIGLGTGALGMAWLAVSGMARARGLRKEGEARIAATHREIETLRNHLQTQMEITAKGNEQLQNQLTTLKGENENLRVMVQGLQQKPDRAAPRTLEVWQRAVETVTNQAPGFAQAWNNAVAAAETEMANAESGLTKFVRKVLGRPPPATLTAAPTPPAETPEA